MPSIFSRKSKSASRVQARPPSGVPENFGNSRGGITHLRRNEQPELMPNNVRPQQGSIPSGTNNNATRVVSSATNMDHFNPRRQSFSVNKNQPGVSASSNVGIAGAGATAAGTAAMTGSSRSVPDARQHPTHSNALPPTQQTMNNISISSEHNTISSNPPSNSSPIAFQSNGFGQSSGIATGTPTLQRQQLPQQHPQNSNASSAPPQSPVPGAGAPSSTGSGPSSSNVSSSPSSSSFWSTDILNGPTLFPRRGFSTALNGYDIYLFGGKAEDRLHNDLSLINSTASKAALIEARGSIPAAREGHAGAFIGRTMFIFGGELVDGRCDENLYAYNMANRTWYRVPIQGNPLVGRKGHTAVSLGSKLFVFGGTVDGYYLQDLVSFDVRIAASQGARWSYIDCGNVVPPGRAGHSCSVYQNHIYIFGGMNQDKCFNDLWAYSLEHQTWARVTPRGATPPARYGHASAVVDDCIFIMGGRTLKGEPLSDFFAYKISLQRWYTFQISSSSWPHQIDPIFTVVKSRLLLYSGNLPHGSGVTNIYSLDTSKIKIQPENPPSRSSNAPKVQSSRPESQATPATKSETATKPSKPTPTQPTTEMRSAATQDAVANAVEQTPIFADTHTNNINMENGNNGVKTSIPSQPDNPQYETGTELNSGAVTESLDNTDTESSNANDEVNGNTPYDNPHSDTLATRARRHRSLLPQRTPCNHKYSDADSHIPSPSSSPIIRASSMVGGAPTERTASRKMQNGVDIHSSTLPVDEAPVSAIDGENGNDSGRASQIQDDNNSKHNSPPASTPPRPTITTNGLYRKEEPRSQSPQADSEDSDSRITPLSPTGELGSYYSSGLSGNPLSAAASTIPPSSSPVRYSQIGQHKSRAHQRRSIVLNQGFVSSGTISPTAASTLGGSVSSLNNTVSGQNSGEILTADPNNLTRDDRRLTIQLRNRNSVVSQSQTSSIALSRESSRILSDSPVALINDGISSLVTEDIPSNFNLPPITTSVQSSQQLPSSTNSSGDVFGKGLVSSPIGTNDTTANTDSNTRIPSVDRVIPDPLRSSEQLSVSSEAKDAVMNAWSSLEAKYLQSRQLGEDGNGDLKGPNTVSDGEKVNGSVSLQSLMSLDTPLTAENAKILSVLLSMRKELSEAKHQLSTVSRVAIERVNEAESGRKAALQEAIYLKAKASALSQANPILLSKLNQHRIHDLERLYANTLNDNEALRNQLSSANFSLKQAHDNLAEFKSDAELTRKQLRELEQLYTQLQEKQADNPSLSRSFDKLGLMPPLERSSSNGSDAPQMQQHFEAKLREAEAQLASKDREIASLRSSEIERTEQVEGALRSSAAANERATRLQEMLEESLFKIDKLDTQVVELTGLLEEQKAHSQRQKERANSFEKLWADAKEEISAFNVLRTSMEKMENKEQQIAELQRRLSDAQGKMREGVQPRSSFSSDTSSQSPDVRIREFQTAYLAAHRQWSEARDEVMSLRKVLRETDDRRRDMETKLAGRERELDDMQARLSAFTELLQEYASKKTGSSLDRIGKREESTGVVLHDDNISVSSMLAAIQQLQRSSSLVRSNTESIKN